MRHRQRAHQARLLGGAALVALVLAAGTASAQAAGGITIAPQPLDAALNELGVQGNQQVLIRSDVTAGKTTRGVTNAPSFEAALTAMLAGTGLTYRREGDTFLIVQGGEGGTSPQDEGAGDVDALIVTAQKKEEAIQDVPIAISAFTQKSLDAQKIEGGFDLLKAIPNVTFSKTNFTGYNFSIRGIGTKAVSASTDPGVAVAFNNSSLIVNRLFEQEYFDVERVEVLRGPQGTLYGRNATAGVINVISAKPRFGEFEGDVKLEGGNYNAQRVRGMVNIPVGETLAVRLAGALTKRDGYGLNIADGSDVDDRNLWSMRATVAWEPIEQIRASLLWEHFEEDDGRVRTSKQLCHHDPGPERVAGYDLTSSPFSPFVRGALSQGCLPGSLYDDGAFGTPNGLAIPFVAAMGDFPLLGGNPYFVDPAGAPCAAMTAFSTLKPLSPCSPDPYGNRMQSRNLREIESLIQPKYRAKADTLDLTVDVDLGPSLTLTSQTVYNRDELYSTQDFNRFHTVPIFNDSSIACDTFFGIVSCPGPFAGGLYDVLPGGIYNDPQLGPSDTLVGQDISRSDSSQFNQEFRLQSNFDSALNFSVGANYTRFRTVNDYFVFFNALNLLGHFIPFSIPYGGCMPTPTDLSGVGCSYYADQNPLESIDGQGHNYFRSQNPYRLTSAALFGELYWELTDKLKLTAGARMTWDRKTFTPIPSQTLLNDYRPIALLEGGLPGEGPESCRFPLYCQISGSAVDGYGYPADPDIVQEWTEPTGRLGLDWKPDLGFTDETMLYAFVAHGYKGGGANPPGIAWPQGLFIKQAQGALAPPTFEPEFVDALEIGAKNALLGGALTLNLGAFYYDYKDYQVSKILDRSAANENFDATVWGAEAEWIFSPTRNLRFNGTFGYLETEIGEGEQSIDLMDRIQGNTDWVVIKPFLTQSSNCVAPASLVAAVLGATNNQHTLLVRFCPSGDISGISYKPPPNQGGTSIPGTAGLYFNPATDAPNGGAGFFADIGGNELPNAPHWTASFGAQYRFALPGGWDGTLRGDFYWQSQSYARVYNTQYDKLRAWTNANISFWVENPDWGVTAEVYVKNVFDEIPITDTFLNSDDTALTTNVFTLDPRLIGVSVRKSF